MNALRYETFLCLAFGFAANGTTGLKSCDPAHLADAGIFSNRQILRAKTGVQYAMAILNHAVSKHLGDDPRHQQFDSKVEQLLLDAFQSRDVNTLFTVIETYHTDIIDVYFDINKGNISLK